MKLLKNLSFFFLLSISFVLSANMPQEDPPTEEPCDKCTQTCNACLQYNVLFGRMINEPELPTGNFSVYTLLPTPTIYTPGKLVFSHPLASKIATYTQNIPSGSDFAAHIQVDQEKVLYLFKTGSAYGYPEGAFASRVKNYAMRLDADKKPTSSTTPAFIKLVNTDSSVVLYSCETKKPINFTTPSGRILTPTSPGVQLDVKYDDADSIRQIYSGTDGLADVVSTGTDSYQIRLYSAQQVTVPVSEKDLYTFTGSPHTVYDVIKPAGTLNNNKVLFNKTVNGKTFPTTFTYNDAIEDWELINGDGADIIETKKVRSKTAGTENYVETKTVRYKNGPIAYQEKSFVEKLPFGKVEVKKEVGESSYGLVTKTHYYTNASQTGSYSKISGVEYPDRWEKFYYDSYGRTIKKVTPFNNNLFSSADSANVEEIQSYASVYSQDQPEVDDLRPRIVEKRINGITVAKTYFAYYRDNSTGEYVEIEEKTHSASANFGAVGNLRTTKRYYNLNSDFASQGRVKTVQFPDGRLDTYTYTYGNFVPAANYGAYSFTEVQTGLASKTRVVHGTVESPAGYSNKTTADEQIWDRYGNLVVSQTFAYIGGNYTRITWTEYRYDLQNREISQCDSNNKLLEKTWSCCALASETSWDGTVITYSYDDLMRKIVERKVGIGNQADIIKTFNYDANNNITSETISGGNLSLSAQKTYDMAKRLVSHIDQSGLTTTYCYDVTSVPGKIDKTILPGGFTRNAEYYASGEQKSVTGTAQIAQYFGYGVNTDGSIWNKNNQASENSVRWEKSTSNMLGQSILAERSGFNGVVSTTNTYNIKGQLVKTTQTGSAPILYEYDALGNVFRQGLDVDNSGTLELAGNDQISENETNLTSTWVSLTQKVYGKSGSNAATVVSVQKRRVSGFSNNLTAESQSTDIYGNTTVQTQTVDRNAKTVTVNQLSPASTVSQQIVTVNGLKVSQRSETNLTTTFGYDGLGRMISITDPRIGKTTVTYHSEAGKKGLKASITDPAGNSTTYDYDTTTGRLLWEKNALNQYTRYAYNDHGQVTNVWGDVQYPIQFGYDQFGQKTTMRTFRENAAWNGMTWPSNVNGDLTTWTYDAASGLVTSKTDAKGKSVNYTYTVDGKLASRTWARGIVTNYTYDSATGKLLKADYSDTTPDITYTYNRFGQIATIQDATGSRTFTYDNTFNQIKETISGIYSKDLNKSYTTTGMKGQIQGFAIGDVQNYTYTYNDYGRISKITTPMGDFNYTRLVNSDLISQMTRPNGVTSSWSYEDKRNLLTQVQNGSVSDFGYTNNAIGNRTAMSRAGSAFAAPDTISYSYNSRSEVIGAVSNQNSAYNYAYSFDPIGNRLTANLAGTSYNYTTNMLNQYTVINSNQPTYDDDGNMLTNGSWTYTWNGENRMIQAVNGNTKLQLVYDYMGRRIEKKVFDGDTVVSHKRFVYDNYKQVEELDALNSNSVLKRYSWQPEAVGLDVPLSMTDVATAKNYAYTLDANKNASDLTDALGNVVAHYEYSPFGTHVATGSYSGNPFRFSSEVFDSETGLIYYNYRCYNPSLGRWINRDPIEEQGGWNLYVMVGNQIINVIDKFGLTCCGNLRLKQGEACCNDKWAYNPSKKCCFKNMLYTRQPMEICYKSVLKCEENIRKMLKDFGLSNMIGDAIKSELKMSVGGYFTGIITASALGASSALAWGPIGALVFGGVSTITSHIEISSTMDLINTYARECKELKERCNSCSL